MTARHLLAIIAVIVINFILCNNNRSTVSALDEFALDATSFFEPFDHQTDFSKWVPANESKPFKYIKGVNYEGKWEITPSTSAEPNTTGDRSLKLTTPRGLHAIVRVMDVPIVIDGTKDVVIQYEVKFPSEMECGGGYMKLLTFDDLEDINASNASDKFDLESSHLIVFGPDKCLANSRCHYFLSKHDPKLGTRTMRHFEEDVPIGDKDSQTNLYTLILKSDGKFVIKINGKQVSQSDYNTFTPPVFPPKKIIDPNAVDPNKDYQNYIVDTNAKKPDGWDDSQKEFIPDPNDSKPDTWNDDIEPFVTLDQSVQDELKKLWDEDLMGPFEPAMTRNEDCVDMMCGTWKPNMIPNPDYHGAWTPPIIPNPEPPVEWDPPMVENPDYVEITNPHEGVGTIHAVAFDIWTTDGGIEFDNIYIGHSQAEASMIADNTYFKKMKQVKTPMDPFSSHQTASGILEKVKDLLLSTFHIVKARATTYITNPKAVVSDIKTFHEHAPMSAIISTIISTALLLLYACVLIIKKASCLCKTQAKKQPVSHKDSGHSKEESENETNQDDSDEELDEGSPPKNDKGLKKRKNHAKSSSNKLGK